jgi:hypothetical protein
MICSDHALRDSSQFVDCLIIKSEINHISTRTRTRYRQYCCHTEQQQSAEQEVAAVATTVVVVLIVVVSVALLTGRMLQRGHQVGASTV